MNGLTTTAPPTATHREALELAQSDAADVVARLHKVVGTDLAAIEQRLNAVGAPWTPGRIPDVK